MGSPASEQCREQLPPILETQHEVVLTHDFEIYQTEVTQGEYLQVMTFNPSANTTLCGTNGTNCPVESVTWSMAAAYCNALSQPADQCYTCSGSQTSLTCQTAAAYAGAQIYSCPGYRLPTEAEFEYAMRAGTTTAFYSGPALAKNCNQADANADLIGWYKLNSGFPFQILNPVAQKQANDWGLYDVAGNVWEWSHELHAYALGSSKRIDPVETLGISGAPRTIRGGGAGDEAHSLRSAMRLYWDPTQTSNALGFRCVRSLP
jgi:formylglycine-generating enzyme required for sulfatase activity